MDEINSQLKTARDQGEQLAELLALYVYFMQHTPEGRAVGQELERDWQEAVSRLREDKRLIGADFSLREWLLQIRRELLSDSRLLRPVKKVKPRSSRSARKKTLRFRGINE